MEALESGEAWIRVDCVLDVLQGCRFEEVAAVAEVEDFPFVLAGPVGFVWCWGGDSAEFRLAGS